MTWYVIEGGYAATDVQLPPQVMEGTRHARNERAIVIRHDYQTWRTLRERGLVLPSPAVHYQYPGRWPPRDNQRATVEFLVEHDRCICLNGMRTGKTLSALWAADYLMQEGVLRRVLIVAPVSTHETVWERNLFLHFPHRTHRVARSGQTADKRRAAAADGAVQFLVVNPDALHIIAPSLVDIGLVIVDEATAFKNPRSRRWKALAGILAAHQARCWLLTATPTRQSPEDAYGLVRLLHPKKYMTAAQWRDLTMRQVSKFRWVPKHDAAATVSAWLRPSIRFTLADCGDVPQVQYEDLSVELSPEQEALVAALKDEALAELGDGKQITAVHAAALVTKMLQVQCGGVYATDGTGERVVHKVNAPAFFDAIAEYVEEADTPVLVFAPFVAAVDAIVEALRERGLRVGRVAGDVKSEARAEIFDAVQRRELDAVVAVPACMSHGVTLDVASYVLWAAPPFKAEEYEQANGRVLQAGSRKRIVITHVVPSRMVAGLYTRLREKGRLQDTVLDLLAA